MMAAQVRSPLTKEAGVLKEQHEVELGRILIAHGNAYVARTMPAHLNHFYRSVMEANELSGPATQVDRLADWQSLQELARLRPTGAA